MGLSGVGGYSSAGSSGSGPQWQVDYNQLYADAKAGNMTAVIKDLHNLSNDTGRPPYLTDFGINYLIEQLQNSPPLPPAPFTLPIPLPQDPAGWDELNVQAALSNWTMGDSYYPQQAVDALQRLGQEGARPPSLVAQLIGQIQANEGNKNPFSFESNLGEIIDNWQKSQFNPNPFPPDQTF